MIHAGLLGKFAVRLYLVTINEVDDLACRETGPGPGKADMKVTFCKVWGLVSEKASPGLC